MICLVSVKIHSFKIHTEVWCMSAQWTCHLKYDPLIKPVLWTHFIDKIDPLEHKVWFGWISFGPSTLARAWGGNLFLKKNKNKKKRQTFFYDNHFFVTDSAIPVKPTFMNQNIYGGGRRKQSCFLYFVGVSCGTKRVLHMYAYARSIQSVPNSLDEIVFLTQPKTLIENWLLQSKVTDNHNTRWSRRTKITKIIFVCSYFTCRNKLSPTHPPLLPFFFN